MGRLLFQRILALIFCFAFFGATSDVEAGSKVATIVNLRGQAEVLTASGQHRALSVGSQLEEMDTVVTGFDGRVKILFVEGNNEVVVGTRTRVQIKSAGTEEKNTGTSLFLEAGQLRSNVNRKYTGRGKDVFEVRTPNVVAGVRGTIFHVAYDRSSSVVATLKGLVAVQAGSAPALLVSPGEFTMTTRGILQDVRPILRDPVIRKQLQHFEKSIPRDSDSSRRGTPSAKDQALANNAASAAGFKPSAQLRELQNAQSLSEKFGFPVESTFNFVKSDAVTDADRAKAIRELGAQSSGVNSREDSLSFDSVKSPSFVQPSLTGGTPGEVTSTVPTLSKAAYDVPVVSDTTDINRELIRQKQSSQNTAAPKLLPVKPVEPLYPKSPSY